MIAYLNESLELALKFVGGGLMIAAALAIWFGICLIALFAGERIWRFITRKDG